MKALHIRICDIHMAKEALTEYQGGGGGRGAANLHRVSGKDFEN